MVDTPPKTSPGSLPTEAVQADSKPAANTAAAGSNIGEGAFFWPIKPAPKKPLKDQLEDLMKEYENAETGYERNEIKGRIEAIQAKLYPMRFKIRNLGSVEPEGIDWLWKGWIAKGFINLFAGETGAGKSTVIADIVARITTGTPWPSETKHRAPGCVIWLSSEDSAKQLIVPRLIASGANRNNVIEVYGSFSLQDDIDGMRHLLRQIADKGHSADALIIDPVTSYLPGKKLRKVDMNDAGQVRSVLEPWLTLAEECNIAIIAITHFAKDANRSMLNRVLGSGAFSQTCRSLLTITIPDPTEPYSKAMLQIKSNLPEHPGGAWRFNTERCELGVSAKGLAIVATRAVWNELDSSLRPENTIGVGQERGPVSRYANIFPIWLKAEFMTTPADQGRAISDIKRAAIDANIVTERWWNEHSGKYLDKRNINGQWMCRPKA